MTSLIDLLQIKEPPKFTDVLTTLGAGFTAVAALFFTWSENVAPPVPQSVEFFRLLCAALAILIGGALIIWRSSKIFRKAHLYIAALVFAVLGIIGFVAYETADDDLVARFDAGGRSQIRIVADQFQPGLEEVVARLPECQGEAASETPRHISYKCARAFAERYHGRASERLFDTDALKASISRLGWLYRLCGLGFMIAILLVADEIWRRAIAQVNARQRARPVPVTK